MTYANIKMTFYYTDDEMERTMYINLKEGDFKKQIEEFIIGIRNVFKYLNVDFKYLLVDSVSIEYQKKEILDITKLDI